MLDQDFDKLCFVLMPFGEEGTEKWKVNRDIFEDVIKKGVEESGVSLECRRADDITQSGSIPTYVVECCAHSKIVIADLSEHNPNVMYELGVRHSFRHGTILLARKGTVLPFDTTTERTIFYNTSTQDERARARNQLTKYIRKMHDARDIADSPVIRVVGSSKFDRRHHQVADTFRDSSDAFSNNTLRRIDDLLTIRGFIGSTFHDDLAFRIFFRKADNVMQYYPILWSIAQVDNSPAFLASFRRGLRIFDVYANSEELSKSQCSFIVPFAVSLDDSTKSGILGQLVELKRRAALEDFPKGNDRHVSKEFLDSTVIQIWDEPSIAHLETQAVRALQS